MAAESYAEEETEGTVPSYLRDSTALPDFVDSEPVVDNVNLETLSLAHSDGADEFFCPLKPPAAQPEAAR